MSPILPICSKLRLIAAASSSRSITPKEIRRKRGEDPIRQFSIRHRDLLVSVIETSRAGPRSAAAAAEAVETGAAERKQPDGKTEQNNQKQGREKQQKDNKIIIESVYSFLSN